MISLDKIEMELRDEIVKLMLQQIKDELEYEFHGDKQWVYGLSLDTKELDEVIEVENYDCTIVAKVIIKMDGTDLVDGAIIEYDIQTKDGEVKVELNLGFTEYSPAYNGGSIENSIKWFDDRKLMHRGDAYK